MTLWFAAVGFALTGERLAVPEQSAVTAARVVGWLGEQGWPASRVQDHRRRMIEREELWPHPLPEDLIPRGGMAQFHALLAEVRNALDVSGAVPRLRASDTRLTADDRRLLAEVPPHHGRVG